MLAGFFFFCLVFVRCLGTSQRRARTKLQGNSKHMHRERERDRGQKQPQGERKRPTTSASGQSGRPMVGEGGGGAFSVKNVIVIVIHAPRRIDLCMYARTHLITSRPPPSLETRRLDGWERVLHPATLVPKLPMLAFSQSHDVEESTPWEKERERTSEGFGSKWRLLLLSPPALGWYRSAGSPMKPGSLSDATHNTLELLLGGSQGEPTYRPDDSPPSPVHLPAGCHPLSELVPWVGTAWVGR